MPTPENAHIFGIQLRESANDGSDFGNADSDYRVVFLARTASFTRRTRRRCHRLRGDWDCGYASGR